MEEDRTLTNEDVETTGSGSDDAVTDSDQGDATDTDTTDASDSDDADSDADTTDSSL